MTAYEVLAELSADSRDFVTEDRREYLWRNVQRLEEAIRADLTPLADAVYLEQVTVYVDDPSYRQSAAALLFDFRFDVGDPFTVTVICLLDQAYIALRVAKAPADAKFERIRELLHPSRSSVSEMPLSSLRAN